MKTRKGILTLFLWVIGSTFVYSQTDSSGVYFKADDFVKHKLSFASDCKTQKQKIIFEVMFHPKEIIVKHNGKTYKYSKDSVYAVRNCDGSILRIFDNSEFPMLNPSESIMLYRITSGGGGKGGSSITNYFFSKDPKSRMHDLTLLNLKKAYHDNPKFLDALDIEFKSDEELSAYDSYNKMYKLNYVYTTSLGHK